MRDFNDPFDISEVDLWIVVNSVDDMSLNCEWLCVLLLKNNGVNAFDFSVFLIVA